MRKLGDVALLAWLVAVGSLPAACRASEEGDGRAAGPESQRAIALEVSTSFGWTVHEQVENGLLQAGSSDPADDVASGFVFRQGRAGVRYTSDDGGVEGLIRLRLEERIDILDFWGAFRPTRSFSIAIGQMKIPSTGEVLRPDDRLDFITRTTFGRAISDYSLLRTPYVSPVMASKSYNRDLGVALRAEWPAVRPLFGGFGMAGNGLGAGRYIGARESEEFLFTNSFGDYFYGGRLEARPFRRSTLPVEEVVLGTHGSINRHENVSLGSRGPVFDIDRRAWSADIEAAFSWGQRIYGFLGSGEMDDDWGTAQYRFEYSGWGLSTLWKPGASPFELGVRYDEFTNGYDQVEDDTTERHWTAGLNWRARDPLRIQLNYVRKETVSETDPDLDDDILFLNVQFAFAAEASR